MLRLQRSQGAIGSSMLDTVEPLRVVEVTPDHTFGCVPGAVLYVWRKATTMEAARTLRQLVREAIDQAGTNPGVYLGVVEEGASPPSWGVRKELAETFKDGRDFFCASALVFEGSGFQASVVRAVVAGLALFARQPFPHQVFSEVSVATAWLEQHLAERGPAPRPAGELAEHLRALRRVPIG